MKRVQTICFIALITLMGTGCDAIKKLNEMPDTTKSMKKTTEKMADTTDQMKGTTEEMAQTTLNVLETAEDTYQDLRQGNSLTIRSQRIDAMEKAPNIEAKISEAAKYYMAFEFQLWKGVLRDSPERREALYLDAVQEFTRDLRRYVKEYEQDFSPASTNPTRMNFYAMAVAAHELNINQVRLAKEEGFEPVSMLALVKRALVLGREIENGTRKSEDLPEYAQALLSCREGLVQLLQMRMNFLAAMTLAQISEINGNPGFLGIPGLYRKARMLFGKWTPSIDNRNATQLADYNKWMGEALATREFLKGLGVEPKTDKTIRKILSHLDVSKLSQTGIQAGEIVTPEVAGFRAQMVQSRNQIFEKIATFLK